MQLGGQHSSQGWIQRLKKEGVGHRVQIGGHVYKVQLALHIVHDTLGGSGKMLPQKNFELMRVLLRPSEATILHKIYGLCSLTHIVGAVYC